MRGLPSYRLFAARVQLAGAIRSNQEQSGVIRVCPMRARRR
jgi:hypothetical protein